MKKPDAPRLERLNALDKPQLVSLVAQLWESSDDEVCNQIEAALLRNEPAAFAEFLSRQIAGILRGTRFIDYRESGSFAGQLYALHNQLADLMLSDPLTCWKLTDKLLRGDQKIFNRVDDSNGSVGGVFSELCLLWLRSAALLGKSQAHWLELVRDIHDHDDYGARNDFLENANRLLNDETLKTWYDQLLSEPRQSGSDSRAGLHCIVTLHQLSRAMKDPERYYRAELHFYPQPNNLQIINVAKVFLEFDRPDRAREILEQTTWEPRFQADADRLMCEVLEALGDSAELLKLRRSIWEQVPNRWNLERYLALYSLEESTSAKILAADRAKIDPNLAQGVGSLLFLGEYSNAEELLILRHAELSGNGYTELLSIVEQIPAGIAPVGTTLIYRALLVDILNRAYSKAYSHGAKYLKTLRKLGEGVEMWPRGVDSPTVFEAELWLKHGRKHSFWKLVN